MASARRSTRQSFREEVRVPGAPDPVGPWTYVVRAGDQIFVSGFTALDEHGHVVGGDDAGAQARFALDKIRQCLEAAGATFADVCKVTVFYRNIKDREAVNRVREEYFGSTRPASTAVEVSRLVSDELLVEIEVTAVRPPSRSQSA
jgi:2-iminobutanoate/2-iminopropanoate deaminase